MKKHDEGYVMILVLVVMIVMGLVTASILTFSLRNLQNQQLSIERMADKYAAQGELQRRVEEKVRGKIFQAGIEDGYELSEELTSKSGTVEITCILRMTTTHWCYDSYKITYSTGETEEGGGGE